MVYDMKQTVIDACSLPIPLKKSIKRILFSVQLHSSSDEDLFISALLHIILTISFMTAVSEDLFFIHLLLQKKEKLWYYFQTQGF